MTDETPSTPQPERPDETSNKKKLIAGAAIGIGSAALVAALLYANRSRKNDKKS